MTGSRGSGDIKPGEPLHVLPVAIVNELKAIIAEHHMIDEMISSLHTRKARAIVRDKNFWTKLYEDYYLDPNSEYRIDFSTNQLIYEGKK